MTCLKLYSERVRVRVKTSVVYDLTVYVSKQKKREKRIDEDED